MDDMNSRPPEMVEKSLDKIRRNHKVYFGFFMKGWELQEIWEVDPEILVDFTRTNLKERDKNGTSKNNQHTMSYAQKRIKSIGRKIWEKS